MEKMKTYQSYVVQEDTTTSNWQRWNNANMRYLTISTDMAKFLTS
ncbi:hypothetical protein YDYSY3_32250 [Paenibacillus chitinolyticus]|nr:hypothetical protein YDYSY3_32250 [Paenibacillus chitinolyticus]